MTHKLTASGIRLHLAKLSFLSDEHFHMLTPWQRKFVTDVYRKFVQKPELSKKQMDQIDSIFSQIEERM